MKPEFYMQQFSHIRGDLLINLSGIDKFVTKRNKETKTIMVCDRENGLLLWRDNQLLTSKFQYSYAVYSFIGSCRIKGKALFLRESFIGFGIQLRCIPSDREDQSESYFPVRFI